MSHHFNIASNANHMELFEKPEFYFPKIENIKLENFSLYTKEPNASVNIPNGVLCIAGANGIGKSTFLASVNYGLTGGVPDPPPIKESSFKVRTDIWTGLKNIGGINGQKELHPGTDYSQAA